MSTSMTMGQAQLALIQLNTEAESIDKTDFFVWLTTQGVPVAISTRLEELCDVTRRIADQVINIGKILFNTIYNFIKKYPGTVIGAALGAAIASLMGSVPLIGPILLPLAEALGIVVGGWIGSNFNSEIRALLPLAEDFFRMLVDIFLSLKDKLFSNQTGA